MPYWEDITVNEAQQRKEQVLNGLLAEDCYHNLSEPYTLEERMGHYHTPGCSIAVIKDGKIDWAASFGVRRMSTGEPVTPNILFQAGSVSKPTFALAVMRLYEQGLLDIDADVNTYLKSWKVPDFGGISPRITLRQILGHVAGLTVNGFLGYLQTQKIPTVPQILDGKEPANSPAVRVDILPGTQFRYSGGGTTVAQLAVTDLLERELPDIMQELVLGPVGMEKSGYFQPLPESLRAQAATGHPFNCTEIAGGWHVHPELAAAGLWTTPTELAHLGIHLQNCLAGKAGILTKESMEIMTTPYIESNMGVGYFTEGIGENARFGHTGWNEGYVTKFLMYKYKGLGVVIMLNSNEGKDLMLEIERAIARVYGWPGYFSGDPTAAGSANPVFAGEYCTEFGTKLAVCACREQLTLTMGTLVNVPLVPVGERRFAVQRLNTVLLFHPLENSCPRLTIEQSERRVEAARV